MSFRRSRDIVPGINVLAYLDDFGKIQYPGEPDLSNQRELDLPDLSNHTTHALRYLAGPRCIL